jgi:putative ABC transport system permease protein
MFQNCLTAALRHLERNRLYAAISVLGLAVGLAAALLAALVVRSQLTIDQFVPGHERIHLVTTAVTPPGRATIYLPNVNTFVGPRLAARFSGIEAMTRLHLGDVRLQNGEVSAMERIYWADTNAFEVLALPSVAGEIGSALSRPDAVVLPLSIARKYFGEDAPLGRTLLLDGREPLTVAAVIEDLPANATHLVSGIFLSTLSSHSQLQRADRNPANVPGAPVGFGTNTYLRLASRASVQDLQQAMPAMVEELFSRPPEGWAIALRLVRMDELNIDPGLNPGIGNRLLMTLVVGCGILLIACINFINLLTARSLRRAPEVGLRKLAGASRGVLVAQFLGESVAYVAVAMLVGVAVAELLLPYANAALDAGIQFGYWREPGMMALVALAAVVLGILAGAWPAFAMAAFPPLHMLKHGVTPSRARGVLRQGLVTLQFAILIGFVIAAGVVWQQRLYATGDAVQVDADQMLLIRAPCKAFATEVARLPGVQGLACSDQGITGGFSIMTMKARDGIEQLVFLSQVSPRMFDLYGVRPLAGKLNGSPGGTYYVLNETAARRLGYTDPAQIVGTALPAGGPPGQGVTDHEVIGVVPDFSLTSVERSIEAMAYVVNSGDPGFDLVSVRLTGQQVPETLAAIDRLWEQSGARDPISRTFLEDYIQRLYESMLRQAQVFAGFSLLAVMLACLGLLGLAAAVAERRTKEIGIRKALGAGTRDVLRLLLWQFSKPVLWANLIAWPVAGFLMHRWLAGFAYRIDLPLWLFPFASSMALLIALATISAHSLRMAGSRPIAALRRE